MDGIVTLVIIGLVIFFGSIFGFISFFSRGDTRRQLDEMRTTLRKQALDIDALKLALAGGARAPTPPEPEPAPERQPERVAQEPIAAPLPEAPAEAPVQVPPTPPKPPSPPQPSFEELLTSRWLVWLGALTIALGGVFLVKFSIDYGLITPEMRVIFGFLLGVALVGFGEWLRRRGADMKIEALRGSYVPPALTAAGLFVAFASTYAAFALYQMMSPLATFIALAVLALAAIVLSIWHGRGVAILGLLGGFVTPLMVATDEPSAWALFSYLAALVVALVTLIRFMRWYELLWLVLVGIGFWTIAWMLSEWRPGDIAATGVFFFVTAAAFCAAFWDAPARSGPTAARASPPLDLPPALIASLAVVFAGALIAFDADGYRTGTIVVLAALTVLQLAIAARAERLASLAVTSTILVVATFLLWPSIAGDPTPMPGKPTASEAFLWTIGAFAAAFAVLGFSKIWQGERTLLWAWLSAATPLVLFALAYARVLDFGNDTMWAAAAIALSLLALLAVERCLAFRDRPGMIEAVGAYSTAVIAALSLALVMVLEEAWLTVALSLLLPALAWTDRRLDIPAHRSIALVVAAIVIVRLVLNPDVLSYEARAFGSASWVLYGYGVPALACFAAARLFAQKGRDHTVTTLESATLLFTVVLVFFEIRALTEGSLVARRFGLFEAALHTLAWGMGAYGLEQLAARTKNPVASIGWRLLLAAATFNVVLFHLIGRNPMGSAESVGELPILNLLLLAYAVPAALAFLFAMRFREREPWLTPYPGSAVAAVAGFVLAFAWISLETRRAFRGPVLSEGVASDAELYAYSVVWLAYAGVLLALAIRQRSLALRWASLVVLFITVGKVFLSDMAALTGLWRVASFIGLGLTLVGIGYLYQRYVFPHRPKPDEPAPAAP